MSVRRATEEETARANTSSAPKMDPEIKQLVNQVNGYVKYMSLLHFKSKRKIRTESIVLA